jgi:hypothetical protein
MPIDLSATPALAAEKSKERFEDLQKAHLALWQEKAVTPDEAWTLLINLFAAATVPYPLEALKQVFPGFIATLDLAMKQALQNKLIEAKIRDGLNGAPLQ